MTGHVSFPVARPFLKWAGGKAGIMYQVTSHLPEKFRRYHEPFLGGGAMFFELVARGCFRLGGLEPFLADSNHELVTTWQALRDFPIQVISNLANKQAKHDPDDSGFYYSQRDQAPDPVSPVYEALVASRMIYLNKTCFNGLYRVNKSNRFNVPFGKYKSPTILDEPNLYAVSRVLRETEAQVHTRDFEVSCKLPVPEDFVYLDPPYVPASHTSSFTAFTPGGFGKQEQERLADLYQSMFACGVLVLASNSDTPLVRDLYKNFELIQVQRSGAISSKASGRQPVGELLIKSY